MGHHLRIYSQTKKLKSQLKFFKVKEKEKKTSFNWIAKFLFLLSELHLRYTVTCTEKKH